MDASQMIAIRNRIIGVLIERERRRLGKSIEVCAELLGCSPAEFRRYELGQDALSLPQLESLSRFLDVPVDQFWKDEAVPEREVTTGSSTNTRGVGSRGKDLAARFQQCRRASGLSRQDVGQLIGQSAEVIAQYEKAERQIPIAELEIVAARCGLSLADFEEPAITAGRTRQEALDLARLKALPPDLLEFVLDPGNAVYLRIARALGVIESENLRQIAEAILEPPA